MGASEWANFVPYQADIAAALREAQHQEYRERFEGRPLRQEAIDLTRSYLDEPWFSRIHPDPNDQARSRKWVEDRIAQIQSLPEPASIDEAIQELVMLQAEEGTGSILDMNGLSDKEDYFKIAPLSPEELINLFGTDKPDHAMVEAKLHEVTDLRDSQKGSYLIVYKDGQPDEIFFGGFSGD